eukprot:6203102-Pleurochrysis_carterae.AAC.3
MSDAQCEHVKTKSYLPIAESMSLHLKQMQKCVVTCGCKLLRSPTKRSTLRFYGNSNADDCIMTLVAELKYLILSFITSLAA